MGATALLACLPATAGAQGIDREPFKSTIQLSSGDSGEPSISQDDRLATVVAFRQGRNVVAVFRSGSFSNEGEAWQPGETRVISRGRNGAANGASGRPDVGGFPGFPPRCIAFISRASNLVRGDTNGRADAFVYDLRSRRIRRVSTTSRGRQANGDTTEVSVNGDCTRVAFTSTATNLALRGTQGLSTKRRRSWRFAVTEEPRRGQRNVYVKFVSNRHANDAILNGLTYLASARGGEPTGDSFEPHLNVLRGDVLAFASTGRLAGGDDNSAADVYVKTLTKERVPTRGGRTTTLDVGTSLISRGGNGPSRRPNMDGRGRFVYFDTSATDLLPDDGNGHTDVARADRAGGGSIIPVSEGPAGTYGNGPSTTPVSSGGGTNALFLTDASNFFVPGGPQQNFGFRPTGPGDNNGVRDAALWTVNRRIALIESRGAGGELLASSTNSVDMSHRTNYIVFESGGAMFLRYLGPRSIGN